LKVAVYIKSHGMSAKTTGKVMKATRKTALKQPEETYNLSDLMKHDPHCGFIELGGSVSVS
jgi:hypothetical protein